MSDSIEMGLELAKESMDHAVNHLTSELSKIRTGKASPGMLKGLKVDYYGSPKELKELEKLIDNICFKYIK